MCDLDLVDFVFAVARFREGERRLIKVFPFVLFLGFHRTVSDPESSWVHLFAARRANTVEILHDGITLRWHCTLSWLFMV